MALTESIRVQFDRFLAPYGAVRQSVCIESASLGPPDAALKRCQTAGFQPIYDPVDRVAVFQPSSPLLPNTRYNVVVLAPDSQSTGYGIRAFDQGLLETNYTFSFSTGDGSELPSPARRDVSFCHPSSECLPSASSAAADAAEPARDETTPLGILRRCGTGTNCHGPDPAQGVPPYGEVLRLRNPEGVSADGTGGIASALRPLIDQAQVATETATALNPAEVQRGIDTAFGQNMPYIDRNSPGNSYLLYKLIIGLNEADRVSTPPTKDQCPADAWPSSAGGNEDDGGSASTPSTPFPLEPWVPDAVWHPAAPGEYDRLRQVIQGDPMPYLGQAPWWWAETLGAWITDGARLDPCE